MSLPLFKNPRGAAAAEMALVLPILLALFFGAIELGNYFRSEHILLKGVRDGAVYAARQEIPVNYNCGGGAPPIPATVTNNTKALVRTGALSGGSDLLPLWDDGSTTFTVTFTCVTAAGGTNLSGIYLVNGNQIPVVTVNASLPYRSVLGALGISTLGLRLKAAQQAAATGI